MKIFKTACLTSSNKHGTLCIVNCCTGMFDLIDESINILINIKVSFFRKVTNLNFKFSQRLLCLLG
jgi:hypothetical protein